MIIQMILFNANNRSPRSQIGDQHLKVANKKRLQQKKPSPTSILLRRVDLDLTEFFPTCNPSNYLYLDLFSDTHTLRIQYEYAWSQIHYV